MKQAELVAAVRRMTEVPSAPFEEHAARSALHRWLDALKLPFELDPYGNTIVRVRRGMPRRSVAFVAHLDHPGFRVEAVAGGLAQCVAEGSLPTVGLKGARVIFPAAQGGPVKGQVASFKTEEDNGRVRVTKLAVKLPARGAQPLANDFGVLDLPAFGKSGHRLKSRACDDLVGCVAIVAGLAELAKGQATCEAIGVFTRAEEVGFHGSIAVAIDKRLPRDAFVVSVECSNALDGIALGKGPVVRTGDRFGPFDPRVCATVLGAAKQLGAKKLTFQSGVMRGGTCEATAFTAFGYSAGGIALPLANYHNQGPRGVALEEVDLRDLEGAVKLIVATALRVGGGTDDLDLYRNDLVMRSQEGREKLHQPINPITGYPTGAKF